MPMMKRGYALTEAVVEEAAWSPENQVAAYAAVASEDTQPEEETEKQEG